MKKGYLPFVISLWIISMAAVIAAFRYRLVLPAGRSPWLLSALAIALLLFAAFCGKQYASGGRTPIQRRLSLSLAIGNGALGLSGLVVVLCDPPTSQMMKWILPGLVISSLILFQGLVLWSAFTKEDKSSL